MATEKEIYRLLGRAMADEAFRIAMTEDAVMAAESMGISLNAEQAAALKETNLSSASDALDGRLARRAGI